MSSLSRHCLTSRAPVQKPRKQASKAESKVNCQFAVAWVCRRTHVVRGHGHSRKITSDMMITIPRGVGGSRPWVTLQPDGQI